MSDPKGTASAAKGKMPKPRANVVRKSKAEREAYAKEEAEKAAIRAAAANQAASKTGPSTKSSSVKKRDTLRDNRDNSQGAGGSGGVFGAGSGLRQSRRQAADGGRIEMLEGQEGVRPSDGPKLQGQEGGSGSGGGGGGGGSGGGKGTSTMSGAGATSRLQQGGTMYEEDNEPDESRRDIERIEISSDEEPLDDEANTDKGKARAMSEVRKTKQSLGLRPVRAPRTLAEETTEVGKRGARKTAKSSKTVVDDLDGPEDIDEMTIDEEQDINNSLKQDAPSSPELSKRVKPVKKAGPRAKDTKVAAETVEERAERLRLQDDVEKLREQFTPAIKVKKDNENDIERDDSARTDGKLFLFQFPPLVPFLVDQTSGHQTGQDGKQETATIKSDPDGPAPTASALPPDNSTSGLAAPKTQVEGVLTASEPLRLPPGRVGKLRVHKSGKVTLDWGGTDMEVRYGTEVGFLQDAVLVETPAQPNEDDERDAASLIGRTYALGQVQKKMIVIPDWQKLYD